MDESSLIVATKAATAAEVLSRLHLLGFTEFREAGAVDDSAYLFTRGDASGTAKIIPPPAPIEDVVERVAAAEVGFVQPLFHTADGTPMFFRPRVLAKAHPDMPTGELEAYLSSLGTVRDRNFGGIPNLYRIQVDEIRSGLELLDRTNSLEDTGVFDYVGPVKVTQNPPSSSPNDPELAQSWNLHNEGQLDTACVNDPTYESSYGPCQGGGAPYGCRCLDVNAPAAWTGADPIGVSDVTIAVLDTGVDATPHPLLPLPFGVDFTTDPPTSPGGWPVGICDNHGTAVAGVIFGLWDNATGSTGIAPGLTLASGRWPTYDTPPPSLPGSCIPSIPYDNLVLALEWAGDIEAQIVVLSWNFLADDSIEDAFAYARNQEGILSFVSAGNDPNTVVFPATLTTTIAVSNLDFAGSSPQLASDSSRGAEVDFTAPGTRIFTTDRAGSAGYCPAYAGSPHFLCPAGSLSDHWFYADGTSYSTPLVAGIAGLVISRYPSILPPGPLAKRWGPEAVEWVLRQAARDLGSPGLDPNFGWGLPLADRALEIVDELATVGEMIFHNGFEQGNICSWSATQNGAILCAD